MGGVGGVEGAQFQGGPLLGEVQVHPAGRIARFERVGDGGEVDQVEALLLLEVPVVGVAEDQRLHLFAGGEEVEPLRPQNQAIAAALWVPKSAIDRVSCRPAIL